MMIKYYLLVGLTVVLSVFANFFLKKGASAQSGTALLNADLIYGLLLLGLGFVAYYLSLSKININIVYPTMTAFTVIAIVIMSHYIFNEALTIKHIIAIIIILFGVILMYV